MLDTNGRLPVGEFLSFRMCRALGATEKDLERVVFAELRPDNEKIRFNPLYDEDSSTRTHVGFAHGHSGESAAFIDFESSMGVVTADQLEG